MKKISLWILCFVCLLLAGCTSNESKEVGTLEKFQSNCVNNGIEYADLLSQYQSQKADYITGAIRCSSDDLTIEMVTYDSEESADKAQKQHIASFMAMKSTAATAKKDKGKNYYKFTMISNGYFMVTSRIENTLIFSKTPLANKEKVEAILTDMNY